MHKFRVLILIIFFRLISFSQTSNYQFSHLSTADGLSQSSVITIHQDNLGQIWIGTRDGLNKYDGSKFTTYRNEVNNQNSISNNDILSVVQDTQGFIWIGTYNGLNKYNPETNTFIRYFHNTDSSSLINNTIGIIKQLSNGMIWIGTSNGLSIYNRDTDSFKNYLKANSQSNQTGSQILAIQEAENNSVFIGTTNGLIEASNIKNNISFKTVEKSKDLYIQDLANGKNGKLLLATRDEGVLEYDKHYKTIKKYLSESFTDVNNNSRQLQYDDNGNLWIGTYDGIQVVDKDKRVTTLVANINDANSLSKNPVKSIFKDKKGTIWIGTYYGGVNIWDASNENFTSIIQTPNKQGLSYNVVSSIESNKNSIFFGTEGGGITKLNRSDNTYDYINKTNTPELLDDNIKSLFLSQKNRLWIGTFNNGLAIYDLNLKNIYTSEIPNKLSKYLQNIGVYTIKQDVDKNLWIGTFGKGLIKYNPVNKNFKIYKYKADTTNSLSSNLIRTVTIDSKGNIWVGTERGLNKINFNDEIETYFYDSKLISGEDILSVFEDRNYTIWVGTKGKGLFKLVNSTFQSVDLKVNETKLFTIHSILEDKTNHLWIATNQGLVKYNYNTQKTTIHNQKGGLVSNEFNDNACLKIDDSKFYFGGPSGVVFFDSEHLIGNDYAPKVIISDFKIKQKSIILENEESILEKTISFTETLDLDHHQGNFSISFAIPNFINSNNNRYKFRLKGLEDDWIETSENSAYYTIQNAGDYIFEVKGANNDGVWNENATQLSIKVHPAPWRSWWAFLLYGLLILGALYFLIVILKSRTKLQTELELEHLEVERTKEANRAKLQFFTNISHEFRTPLTLILGPLHQILEDYTGSSIMYKKLMTIESSANQLLHLINRLMDFRKLENKLLKLESAEGNIVKFLKEIYLSFNEYAKGGEYDYTFHTSDEEILVFYDRYKLERVFYNLISNAFRYTHKKGKIVVRIIKEEHQIKIQVEDSGVGIAKEYQDKIFERFFEVSVNNKPDSDYNKGTGIGLSIAKSIVDLHKGEIYVRSNYNEGGSIFYVTLPLGRAHLTDDEIIKDFKFSDDVSQYVKQLDNSEIINFADISEQLKSKEKYTILLVEDHKPLRKFMHSILINTYNVLEAENGKVALKLAQEESPDLIISDVVMPVMVGTELCRAIKEDLRTSHIPIILLTSRSALVYKLEGLESGADDYISKPFNIKEFQLRIKNLLVSKAKLKEKFKSEHPLIPNEITVSSLDEKLYKKSLKIVEENIGNDQFDVPYFCSELGVSRTMLFVKIKAWTNYTPNEFIQHFRMKRAAQILEQGKLNISEVSYMVGFKNPKYFSKCFQKKFGETPTQYANKFLNIS